MRSPGILSSVIGCPKVDQSYSQPEECLLAGDGDLGGAYIVRLPCGDSNDYLRHAHMLSLAACSVVIDQDEEHMANM